MRFRELDGDKLGKLRIESGAVGAEEGTSKAISSPVLTDSAMELPFLEGDGHSIHVVHS